MSSAAPGSFTTIPQIDLAEADAGPAAKKKLLSHLRNALTDVGFLYIRNHGVPDQVVSDIVTIALPTIATLSASEREAIALVNSPHFLGYSSVGSETTAGKADHREQIELATELEDTWVEGRPIYERLYGPNQWPAGRDEFRSVVEWYSAELTQLGERFLRLVAEALGLPREEFIPFLSKQQRLKLVHYPALSPDKFAAAAADGGVVQGVGPHKDSSGWWTFLLQASPPDVGGLQVLNKDGDWIDVPNLPGTFVVNIGQAFEVLTHGVCRATTHRVVVERSGRERYSVPFFQGVRGDLTKGEALGALSDWFAAWGRDGVESTEGEEIDSAFLRGKYDTWGESQLRTKVRSHRDIGKRFYGELFKVYTED